MKSNSQISKGFILPSVLAISFATILIMTTLLMVATASNLGNRADHYQKLADEAAEAGTAYATGCLGLSSHIQTWGPAVSKPSLAPSTDCAGATSYSSNTYVYSSANVRSYFTVGNLDYAVAYSVQISATGYAEVLNSAGTVIKTYTSVQKKVITWPTDTAALMSASGTNRTCAIVNYQVYCWGYNAYGQLGDGRYLGPPSDISAESSIDSTTPVKVKQDPGVMAGKKIVKIFVAQYHSCALSDDGLMYCWGYNYSGQLGTGNKVDSAVPVQVAGALSGKVVTDIGGTNNATCAIAAGKIYCWGVNSYGVLGINGAGGSVTSPTAVTASNTATTLPTNYTATALSTSGSRALLMCAVASGKAYCWGQNDAGSVGNGTTSSSVIVPTKVSDATVLSGKTVTSISQDGYVSVGSGGFSHVCVVANLRLYCWGENSDGQLGEGTLNDSSIPVAVTTAGTPINGVDIKDVKVGLRHTCALTTAGAVYCWGNNGNGQVGDGTTTGRMVPTAVFQSSTGLTGTNTVSIGAGANRGCAVISDGRTFCWGYNSSGQIGDGTTTNRSKPTESLFLRPVANQYIF